jgi:hypothetical protein
MDKIIVYLDDADYAQQHVVPMAGAAVSGERAGRTHWVLVACPPRMTRRISKWVSHSAREIWRDKWSGKVFEQLVPQLQARGDEVTTVVARGVLVDLTQSLMAKHGASRVLDARRPKFGQDLQPVTADQPAPTGRDWEVPGAVAGMGALLVLAAE